MSAGRPPIGDVDRLVSLGQYWYLRLSMHYDEGELAQWLNVNSEIRNVEVRRFLRHNGAFGHKRMLQLDALVPGIYRITLWPWRQLAGAWREKKLLRDAENSLSIAKDQRTDFYSERERCANPAFVALGHPALWILAEDFFGALLEYRYEQWGGEQNARRVVRLTCSMLDRFDMAILHPLIGQLKAEIADQIFRILPHHLGSVTARMQFGFHYLQVVRYHNIRFGTRPAAVGPRS